MDKIDATAALSALGQSLRLDVFRLLARVQHDGLTVSDIATVLNVRQNTLSANLAVMVQAGLLTRQRNGRTIRYRVNQNGVKDLLAYLLEDCCAGREELCLPAFASLTQTTAQKEARMKNVLFLCQGNSARSLMAEQIIMREGIGKFRGFSAGAQPAESPHPYTVDLLRNLNHDTSSLRSKNWGEFSEQGAPKMDFVFTVCDKAAAETCPVWPGQPMSAHWGVPDPVGVEGSEAERRLAFADAYRMLRNRITAFVSLPMDELNRLSLQRRLDEIGEMDNEKV